MARRLCRQGNLESAAAKTSHSAKTPQSFRIPRRPCRESGDSPENVLPCVLGLWRKKAQRSAIRVPRSGASLLYSTHGKYFASEGRSERVGPLVGNKHS